MKRKHIITRAIHLLVASLFLLFAIIQLNDPDPFLWVVVYSYVALVAFLSAFGIKNKIILFISILVLLIWFIAYIPPFIDWINSGAPSITSEMKAESPHIELVREFFGLFLCLITLLVYFKK